MEDPPVRVLPCIVKRTAMPSIKCMEKANDFPEIYQLDQSQQGRTPSIGKKTLGLRKPASWSLFGLPHLLQDEDDWAGGHEPLHFCRQGSA